MKQYASFENYLQDKYYNEIFRAVKNFIWKSGRKGLSSYMILDVGYVELDDVHVRNVKFHATDGNRITFVAAVEADVILKGMGKRNYDADEKAQWYSVSFTGYLSDGLNMVTITDTGEYHADMFDKETSLSKYLVPYLYAENLEKEAEKFLDKYCRAALHTPMPLPIDELLFNMGLVKYNAPLKDNTFGMTYFTEADVDVYDDEAGEIIKEHIEPGTMLINPNVFFMRNIGSENNTIVHECIHWVRHDKFFELQKLLNSDLRALSCSVAEQKSITDKGLEGALQWMEWQANALAPRILMPRVTTTEKLKSILLNLTTEMPDSTDSERMEKAICRLAEFFRVSRIAAKLRAIELGFTTAAGVLNYVDGAYLHSFSFDSSALGKDETYIIDEKNSTYEACIDKSTKAILDRGSYVYVDYMFCIDDSKYVMIAENGDMTLTQYARQHVDECCLKFKNTYRVSATSGDEYYTKCALCKNIAADVYSEANYVDDDRNGFVAEQAEKCKNQKREAIYIIGILSKLSPLFTGTLQYHYENYEDKNLNCGEMTEMELGCRTHYSERQIRTFLTDENANKDIQATCALCIGLHLIPDFSDDLVDKSGHTWKMTEEEYHYQKILHHQYKNSLNTINARLVALGCRPWGGRSKGE